MTAVRATAPTTTTGPSVDRLRAVAGSVPDPEIPVLTLDDLGIVRDVRVEPDGTVGVTLTPTYTGCPATAVIAADVESALRQAGADRVVVRTVLAPAWTTDWMSEAGRTKLRKYGIAAPDACGPRTTTGTVTSVPSVTSVTSVTSVNLTARCPRCGSANTREISRFGSTPCKSLWSCRDCAEPFDSFKAI